MLNGIKSMIIEKQEYLEAAQIIFEDAAHGGIDNLIILNEAADVPKDDDEIVDPNLGDEGIEKGEDEDKKNDDGPEEGDISNIPIDDDKDTLKDGDNPDVLPGPESQDDDLLGASIDGDDIQPTLSPGDDLPPVGGVLDDLLNVSIDLKSNTITDVLPVPPDNAGEAIADDLLATRVDSGFQEDGQAATPPATPASATPPAPVQSSDPAGTAAGFPMDESKNGILSESIDSDNKKEAELTKKKEAEAMKESKDTFLEAITLDGGGEKPADGTEPAAPAASTPEDPGDPPAEEGAGENEVTSAVMDKVAEADAPIEGGSAASGKEALLKKLGSLTKGLEDAKKAVMDTIQ